jgi:hypothetical protein
MIESKGVGRRGAYCDVRSARRATNPLFALAPKQHILSVLGYV